MLLYTMLYIVLAYLMLFAALTNSVCLNNASFFFLFKYFLCQGYELSGEIALKNNLYYYYSKEKRKVVRTIIELIKETIAKFENDIRLSDLAAQYNMAKSTISSFLKNKDAIKATDVTIEVMIVHSKQRPQIMDEVAKLLLISTKETEYISDSIIEGIICEKALRIYADLLKETPSTCAEGECGFTFIASEGWLENLSNEVESIALLGTERRPVHTMNLLKSILANFVTSQMQVISPSKCLTLT